MVVSLNSVLESNEEEDEIRRPILLESFLSTKIAAKLDHANTGRAHLQQSLPENELHLITAKKTSLMGTGVFRV